MIRLRLAEQLAEKAFQEKRRIDWKDVSAATGIHRSTLSKMLNVPGYNATVDNLDRLCNFFGCGVSDLAEYVPSAPPAPRKSSVSAKNADTD